MLEIIKIRREADIGCTSRNQIIVVCFPLSGRFKLICDQGCVNTFQIIGFEEAVEICKDELVIWDEFVEVLEHVEGCSWSKYVVIYGVMMPVVLPKILNPLDHTSYLHFLVDHDVILLWHRLQMLQEL